MGDDEASVEPAVPEQAQASTSALTQNDTPSKIDDIEADAEAEVNESFIEDFTDLADILHALTEDEEFISPNNAEPPKQQSA